MNDFAHLPDRADGRVNPHLGFGHSSFFRHSDFVIRHSLTVSPQT
ncbi:MAG: hypothetical protein JWN70_3373 [Planctomycetaceae bacterium]|nr:hypothetical protein [Planctomycetaceae bacterium]